MGKNGRHSRNVSSHFRFRRYTRPHHIPDIRRFDIDVLSAEVLLQRVKKLIHGSRSVDGATKLMLYERFARIVNDNLEEQAKSGS